MYHFIVELLSPYTFLVLALAGALIWGWRGKRPHSRPQRFALGLILLLCTFSLPAVGHFARGSLEWNYPQSNEVPSQNDTIVVLAANTHITNREATKLRLGDESLYRCLHAHDLYEKAGGCRIILSGGIVDSSPDGMSVAEAMQEVLVALGVPPANLVLEDESSTTYENARNTCRILNDETQARVFLVTAAFHMYRAERCFAKQGATVIPAPCNHLAVRLELSPRSFIPTLSGIGGVQLASHEWLGIAWYWLRGRI